MTLPERLSALMAEAQAFVPRDQAEARARHWLGGTPASPDAPEWIAARVLASELALSVPSVMGITAFDRLARSMKGRSAEDIAAAKLLARGRLRLARIDGRRFEDLATGETFEYWPSPLAAATADGVSFGLFATIGGGRIVAPGMLVPLDNALLALARGFIRPGTNGLGNGVNCADALYRHIVRDRVAASEAKRKPKLPFRPGEDKIDALAEVLAGLDREPTELDLAPARALVTEEALMSALLSVGIARDAGAPKLASAYARIATELVETIALRAANGSARWNLDTIAATLDTAIRHGAFTREALALFDSLRDRATRPAAGPASETTDLDRLMQRIRALRAKTVEHGCTEQEALTAAEKVAELLDRYGLNLSEPDLRKQRCEGVGVDTYRKRPGPIGLCVTPIAALFDCRAWAETCDDGTIRYIFFGLPADVQASVYLHDLIALAFASETAAFQASAFYRGADSSLRRSATTSFQVGLAGGIADKLKALRSARNSAGRGSNGRDLVPIKDSMIDDELRRLGLTFYQRSAAPRRILPAAYNAGKEAGERFEYQPGIEQG